LRRLPVQPTENRLLDLIGKIRPQRGASRKNANDVRDATWLVRVVDDRGQRGVAGLHLVHLHGLHRCPRPVAHLHRVREGLREYATNLLVEQLNLVRVDVATVRLLDDLPAPGAKDGYAGMRQMIEPEAVDIAKRLFGNSRSQRPQMRLQTNQVKSLLTSGDGLKKLRELSAATGPGCQDHQCRPDFLIRSDVDADHAVLMHGQRGR